MSTRAARAASAFLLLSIVVSPGLCARERPIEGADLATQYHAPDVVITSATAMAEVLTGANAAPAHWDVGDPNNVASFACKTLD